MVVVLLIFNIWGAHLWPLIQNALMVFHVVFFLVVIIVLWVMAPHQSAKAVFTEFNNEGGWSSMGLSVMVGQITAIYSLLGESMTYFTDNLLTKIRVRCYSTYIRRNHGRRPIRPNVHVLVLYNQRYYGDYSHYHLSLRRRQCGRRPQ